MPCERINWGGVHGIICTSPVYEFKGFRFEWHSYHGPMPIRRDNGEIRKTIPNGFYDAMDEFGKLSKEEREPFKYEGRRSMSHHGKRCTSAIGDAGLCVHDGGDRQCLYAEAGTSWEYCSMGPSARGLLDELEAKLNLPSTNLNQLPEGES